MSLETSTRTRGTSQILCRFAGGPGGIAGRLAKKIDESQLWACRMLSVSLAALSSAFARIVAGTNMWLGHGMNFYGRAIGFVFFIDSPLGPVWFLWFWWLWWLLCLFWLRWLCWLLGFVVALFWLCAAFVGFLALFASMAS